MTSATSRRFLLLILAAGLAGCSDSSSPSAPTEVQRPASRLYGVVSDTAFRPLAGARIEIVGGPETGAWTTANAEGAFSFTSSTIDDTTQVRAALDGYLAATQTVLFGYSPNYYAYFNLALPVPPVSIAGEYTLTFQADSACTDLPIEMRTRSYMLDVTISGVVFELTPSGRAPIEGVTLHCGACGAETHAWAYTDSEGLYEFIGVWPDGFPATVIWVDKDGFGDPPGLPTPGLPHPSGPGWRAVTIDGDTRFDIELVRR